MHRTDFVFTWTLSCGLYRVCSCLSLCKLIQYALESQDPRLQGIEVQGDQIYGAGDGVKTRSKARHCKQAALSSVCVSVICCFVARYLVLNNYNWCLSVTIWISVWCYVHCYVVLICLQLGFCWERRASVMTLWTELYQNCANICIKVHPVHVCVTTEMRFCDVRGIFLVKTFVIVSVVISDKFLPNQAFGHVAGLVTELRIQSLCFGHVIGLILFCIVLLS